MKNKLSSHVKKHRAKYAAAITAAVLTTGAAGYNKIAPAPPAIVQSVTAFEGLPGNFPGTCQFRANALSDSLPDQACTPAAQNPTVTDANIDQNICNSSFRTGTIRPGTGYTNALKLAVMERYGLAGQSPALFELDHVDSLTNGGDPTSPYNLYPQPYGDLQHPMTQKQRAAYEKNPDGSVLAGAMQKDRVELWVHKQICSGKMTVEQAKSFLDDDWTQGIAFLKNNSGFGSTTEDSAAGN